MKRKRTRKLSIDRKIEREDWLKSNRNCSKRGSKSEVGDNRNNLVSNARKIVLGFDPGNRILKGKEDGR